jgi:hypothetical protein
MVCGQTPGSFVDESSRGFYCGCAETIKGVFQSLPDAGVVHSS